MKHIFIIIIFSPLICYSQSIDDLQVAFTKKSDEKLLQFLDYWNTSIKTNEDSISFGSDLRKDVVEIYKRFYNPFELSKIGEGEWGDSLYTMIKYVIIQNRIDFVVLKEDSLENNENYIFSQEDSSVLQMDSIVDFKPDITFPQTKTLYLTEDYKETLNKFLNRKHHPLGFRGIMNAARAKGSSLEKVRFLNKFLLIIHGHWGGYWYIETHPYVGRICFNKNLDFAKVYFRLVYEGGEAILKKENGKWQLLSSRLTWIE